MVYKKDQMADINWIKRFRNPYLKKSYTSFGQKQNIVSLVFDTDYCCSGVLDTTKKFFQRINLKWDFHALNVENVIFFHTVII